MRRLSLILLLALAALPAAALAAGSATGDGVLELRAVNAVVILSGKGVLWGQMDRGSMRVTALSTPDAQQPYVSGADRIWLPSDNVTAYSGTNLHFRLTGGRYKIRFKGSGLDLTAIGVGSADMTGDPTALTAGDYALDGGKWTIVPLSERVVDYGLQPPPTTTATP